MAAYYNELDPCAAGWLRELIKEGLIAHGEVDTRSIVDVSPGDLRGFTQCHFFAGIGGWSYALRLAGWPDDRPVWTGSCPCQPFSAAGKRKGKADERHLWPEFYRLIKECRPDTVFGEQVAGKLGEEWVDGAANGMEAVNYAFAPVILPACCVGARQERKRFWFVADRFWNEQSRKEPRSRKAGRVGRIIEPFPWHEPWESALARFRAVDDGLPRRVWATDGARNAIVPQVAAEVIRAYLEC